VKTTDLVTVNPAVENTHSAGVDVTGMERNCFATTDIVGNLYWFCFHHTKGDSSLSIGFSYFTSFSTGSASLSSLSLVV